MGNNAVRFLSIGLGSLLLFHGVYTLMHGTGFVEDSIIKFYVPYTQNEPCGLCFGAIMMGTNFMKTTMTGSSSEYSTYIMYAGYSIYIAELIAPLFLIFNRFTKIAAIIIAIDIILVMILEYKDKFFTLTEHGAWSMELPMLYFISSVSIILSKKI